MKILVSIFFAVLLSAASNAQVPLHSSFSSASAVIYLDFDGQYVAGTAWNWGGPIDAQPAVLSPAQITEVFTRVSEDYGIFNINVTTDSTIYLAAPAARRVRVIITATSAWYGSAGGVSFVNSFTWANNTPAWVFSSLLGNNVKKVAEAVAHEAGHSLGLQHQSIFDGSCNKVAEYSPGQGSGEIGWAPIMGVGYSKNLTTWHFGTSAMGCNSFQNDINIIAGATNSVGLRSDDHPDTHSGATPIVVGFGSSASGIINSDADRDVFKFDLLTVNNFQLSAFPQNVGSGNDGANVDIQVALLDQNADTIGRYNPADLLNVGIDTNLNAGTYYLVVDGISNVNLSDYGSLGFYNISASMFTALPIHRLSLTGRMNADQHELHWNYFADEKVKEIHLESASDGIHFNFLTKLGANARTFSWKPFQDEGAHYRVKVIVAADERAYYSNILTLRKSSSRKGVDIVSRIVNDHITINAKRNLTYQLIDEMGRLIQRGSLQAGTNHVAISNLKRGVFFLRVQHNSETYTEKLIKR